MLEQYKAIQKERMAEIPEYHYWGGSYHTTAAGSPFELKSLLGGEVPEGAYRTWSSPGERRG